MVNYPEHVATVCQQRSQVERCSWKGWLVYVSSFGCQSISCVVASYGCESLCDESFWDEIWWRFVGALIRLRVDAVSAMTVEEVYRKHAAELLRFASGLVGPVDAHDVMTDAFLTSIRSKRWAEVSNNRAYLYRAVLNQARMHHRSTARRQLRERRTAASFHQSAVEVDPAVLGAVQQLSTRQRAVVFLTYWHDLPPDQVAALLDIAPGSVRRHLARGRERLRRFLDEQGIR